MITTPENKRGVARTLFSRLLHTGFLISRGLTLGVRAIVRSDDGKFLLVRHTYTPGWHFPGGGVEKGETTEGGLRKELLQETGLHLAGEPILHGVFHNSGVNKRDHVLAYICDVEGAIPNKSSSMEIADVGFFDLSDLPEGTDAGTVRRMKEIVEALEKSHTW